MSQMLFPSAVVYPEGFSYLPDFITSFEADSLLNEIKKVELHAFNFQGFEAKRRVASFGYDYSFDKRSLSQGKEIPEVFQPLIDKAAKQIGVAPGDFSELLITEYPVGSVINWHRDAPPFDVIAGISLGADCIFKLRPHDNGKQGRSAVRTVLVKQRSIYVIKDEARTDWQHSIAPVKQVRYSITLRTLKKTTGKNGIE
jgi:alkylated DNA repair dioxygenase AlkB